MEFFPSLSELELAVLSLVDTVANAMGQVFCIEVSVIIVVIVSSYNL